MDPKDYHEIGQRHSSIKGSWLASGWFLGCLQLSREESGRTPGGAGTGDTPAGCPD